MTRALALAVLVCLTPAAPAQEDRYDVGLRLRLFEREWERHTDAERAATVRDLKEAVNGFFTGRQGRTAEYLDIARRRLAGNEPPAPEVRWAESLQVQPRARLVDAGRFPLELVARPFYKNLGDPPAGATVRVLLGDAAPLTAPLEKLPASVALSWEGVPGPGLGDLALTTEVRAGGRVLAARTQTLSRVERLSERIAALTRAARGVPRKDATLEGVTLRHLSYTLGLLATGETLETDYPAARLLAEAEALTDGKPYYGPDRPGEFWLNVPANGSASVARLFVPPGLSAAKPVPIVVALHGAGGSENLFFDGYGDGYVVRMCQERGWLLLAPRAPGFVSAAPLGGMLDTLAARYPIDPKRVFVLGHSMGAAHTVQLVQANPGRFAAAAAMGGGGVVRTPDAVKDVPWFVGVGTEDFALRSSRSLRDALKKAGVSRLGYREYADVEHMVIARAALPDAFALFDAVAAGR